MSDCIPMRFRSRQQKCRIDSMFAACWILTAVTIGDNRELARGPSGIFIASIPISAQALAFSRIGSISSPLGGVISMVVTFWLFESFSPNFDFSAKGVSRISVVFGFSIVTAVKRAPDVEALSIAQYCANHFPYVVRCCAAAPPDDSRPFS